MFMTLIVWDNATKKMKERTKTSNLIVDHFSLTFVNFSLAWMLYFYEWCQDKGKSLGGVYTRPEMKSTWNEISIHRKRNYVSITFHCGWNETSFILGVTQDKQPIK